MVTRPAPGGMNWPACPAAGAVSLCMEAPGKEEHVLVKAHPRDCFWCSGGEEGVVPQSYRGCTLAVWFSAELEWPADLFYRAAHPFPGPWGPHNWHHHVLGGALREGKFK